MTKTTQTMKGETMTTTTDASVARLQRQTETLARREGVELPSVPQSAWEFMARQGLCAGQALRNLLMPA